MTPEIPNDEFCDEFYEMIKEIPNYEYRDEFYEMIEAPKFVDLSEPDRFRTSKDNDRYWFCTRFGCDQKHEEEMDSEEIYKQFVLRVMSAISPNVRLRKTLYRQDKSPNLKCPRTVPSKLSKSRPVIISSIPQKKGKQIDSMRQNALPKPKTEAIRSSGVDKCWTTPRNKIHPKNPRNFGRVENSKNTTVLVGKDSSRQPVAKVLSHSPTKTAVASGCIPHRLGGVRSRVFDCLQPKPLTKEEIPKPTPPHSHLKLKVCESSLKTKKQPMRLSKTTTTTKGKTCQDVKDTLQRKEQRVRDNKTAVTNEGRSSQEENNILQNTNAKSDENGYCNKEKKEKVIKKLAISNGNEFLESDDKKNIPTFDTNRKSHLEIDKKKYLGKRPRVAQEVTKIVVKTTKDGGHCQGLKYKKPKPTKPKPFRLRTDERGILKETNMEKKLNCLARSKETKTVPYPKHEVASQQGIGTSCSKAVKVTAEPKSSMLPRQNRKGEKINHQVSKPDLSRVKTKEKKTKTLVNTRGVASGKTRIETCSDKRNLRSNVESRRSFLHSTM